MPFSSLVYRRVFQMIKQTAIISCSGDERRFASSYPNIWSKLILLAFSRHYSSCITRVKTIAKFANLPKFLKFWGTATQLWIIRMKETNFYENGHKKCVIVWPPKMVFLANLNPQKIEHWCSMLLFNLIHFLNMIGHIEANGMN